MAPGVVAAGLTWPMMHWTVGTSNAFVYGSAMGATSCALLLVALLAARQFLRLSVPPVRSILTTKRFWLLCFRRTENGIDVAPAGKPGDFLRAPLLLVLLASFNFGLSALVIQFVETAVAAAVFETWPAFAVFLLVWFNRADAEYRRSPEVPPRPNTAEHAALFLLAAAGLLLMFLSMSQDISGPDGIAFSLRTTIGIPLALLTPVLAALDVAASLACGRVLFYFFAHERGTPRRFRPRIESLGPQSRMTLLWLTLFTMLCVRCVSVPSQFALGVLLGGGDVIFSGWSVIGAVAAGVLGFVAISMRRFSNILAAGPGINALGYLSPILALGILAVAGIDVRRFDLFLVGVVLTLTSSILLRGSQDNRIRTAASAG